MNQNFFEKYNHYKALTEKYIEDISAVRDCQWKSIYESMRYSLSAGGKRIRPVFVLAFSELLGVPVGDALPFAGAIEMIHTYSLIHDDLPAMDNDDFRRGKPTNHIVFGEACAILAGDALLNLAFETITKSMSGKFFSTDLKNAVKAMEILADASGRDGMIAGQIMDIEFENRIVSEEEIRRMYSGKTGALIKASCMMPLALSGRGFNDDGSMTREYKQISEFAELIGFGFQLKDDILDIEGSEELLGKPVGSDERQGKNTFAAVFGLERCKSLLEECTKKAIDILKNIDEDRTAFLRDMSLYLLERQA